MTATDLSLCPPASIVIPLLNQEDAWLERAVLSAIRQTVVTEVLVITSPMTRDSNLRVLERLQRRYDSLQVICRPSGTAFPGALNLGIRAARGKRVGFLMSDDWLDRKAVEACLAYDEEIVSTNRTFYAADGVTVLGELAIKHTPEAYRSLQRMSDRANFIEHFLLIHREALIRVGGVDETLGSSPGVDDFDMIWCLLEQGASVAIVSKSFYNYRDHAGERLTRNKREAMVETFNRILDKHVLADGEREDLLREHVPWFGKSIWEHYQTIAPVRPKSFAARSLQSFYRHLFSMKTRIRFHERFFDRRRMTGLGFMNRETTVTEEGKSDRLRARADID